MRINFFLKRKLKILKIKNLLDFRIKKISPLKLLALQYLNGEFSKTDIIVKYLTIKHFLLKNSFPLLYENMQRKRHPPNDYCKNFKQLIKSYQEKGFDYNYPILVNRKMHIIDGTHRLACSLFFNTEKVVIKRRIREKRKISYFGIKWFIYNDIINKEDISLIEKTKDSLLNKKSPYL